MSKSWIENPDRRMIVAKQSNQTVGFGFTDTTGELLGLYVHPDYGRQGIGAKILAKLEQISVELNLAVLRADAAINAEGFYTKQGFVVVERSTHRLSSGVEMVCVKMQKHLTSN